MAANKEIMKALNTLRLDRPGRSYQAAEDVGTTGAPALGAALTELATTYREEAGLWSRSGAKGWKSNEAEAYTVAQRIDEVAAQLDNAGGGAALSVLVVEPPSAIELAAADDRIDAELRESAKRIDAELRESAKRIDAVRDLAGLDRLIADSVAERRGFVREPLPAGVATMVIEPDFPGQVSADEVTAYLRGEANDIPGTPPLTPGSVTPAPEFDNPFERAAAILNGNDAEHVFEMPSTPPMTLDIPTVPPAECCQDMLTDGEDPAPWCDCYGSVRDEHKGPCKYRAHLRADHPITLPATWESESMTTDGHAKPGAAPLLGQPGDAGTGYTHSYVPAGGRKVTYAELLTPVPVASLPAHLSHSQGNTIGDCATKYRLQRVEQLPQVPQWANVGGSAFHAAVEAFERTVAKLGRTPVDLTAYDCEAVWKYHFEGQISAVAATSPVPVSVWRSSRKGVEGRQWWEVNGPQMLRRYLDNRPADVTMDIPVVGVGGIESVSGIEADLTVQVQTPYGPIPFNAKLDRVTVGHVPGHPERGALIIRDYKTSYERPTDTTQLGDYAQVLRTILAANGGPIADVPIYGTYFDARRGEWTDPVDLLEAHPFEAFQYRVTTAHAQKRALTTGPTPARPSNYCGGCAVRYACPIMATKS